MRENKTAEPVPEILWMYQLEPAPPKYELQQYIELYLAENEDCYFCWYLHYYEPILNRSVRTAAERYGMLHHFEDIKAEAIAGIVEALRKYDTNSGIPFVIFQKSFIDNAVEDYIRINRDGMITMTKDTYPILKKIMALFRSIGERTDNDGIQMLADAVGIRPDTVKAYLAIGFLNDRRVDLYRKLDDDGETRLEEYIPDSGDSAEQMYFRAEIEDAVREAYASLTYREQRIVAQRLAFCSDCLSTVTMVEGEPVPFRKQTFADIAISHGLSSAKSAEKIYRAALKKMKGKIMNHYGWGWNYCIE